MIIDILTTLAYVLPVLTLGAVAKEVPPGGFKRGTDGPVSSGVPGVPGGNALIARLLEAAIIGGIVLYGNTILIDERIKALKEDQKEHMRVDEVRDEQTKLQSLENLKIIYKMQADYARYLSTKQGAN